VYTILNPPYRDLLNQVEMRPLDYAYLRQLPPGPQRFYELASFQIYGAIASGRPRAKMRYSSYCQHAPQTRYPDFEHVKKQMYKVHLPHRDSGYIIKVDYEKTVDVDGGTDWEMLYTPGPKALAEYRAFTNRHAGASVDQGSTPRKTEPESNNAGIINEEIKVYPSQEVNLLVAELLNRGISERMTSDLLDAIKPGQNVMDQIEYFDHVKSLDVRGNLTSPTGFLVSLIRDNAPVPENFPTSSRRKKSISEKMADCELHTRYHAYMQHSVHQYMDLHLSVKEREILWLEHAQLFEGIPKPQCDDLTEYSISQSLVESGIVKVPSLAQWKAQEKQN
jgi:hypothetical protein